MPTIDADAHVVESEHTWDFMDPADARYRPLIVAPNGENGRQFWFIENKIRGFARSVITAQAARELSQRAGRNMETPQEARDMENVEPRLRHMDELGIDVQVVHPTIFIELVTNTPEAEVAICKGYNRWLADIWKQANGRIRWSCALPLLDMSAALEELSFAKQHGAVAVFLRPLEGNRMLHDRYFFPLYQEASALDMAMAVHVGNSNTWYGELASRGNAGGGFMQFRLPTIAAFHTVVMNDIPEKFPRLRWAFVEAAAGWLPYVLGDMRRRVEGRGRTLPADLLREYRLYVTCQTDDDVPYILDKAGEDNIVIGTDYGHNDQSTEVEALRILRESGGISAAQYEKIVFHNPKALYSL